MCFCHEGVGRRVATLCAPLELERELDFFTEVHTLLAENFRGAFPPIAEKLGNRLKKKKGLKS